MRIESLTASRFDNTRPCRVVVLEVWVMLLSSEYALGLWTRVIVSLKYPKVIPKLLAQRV